MLSTPADDEGYRWFDILGLPSMSESESAAVQVVTAWMAGELGGQDWERADWLGEVEDFVAGALNADSARLRQLRTWPRSSVWSVALPPLSLIFKASPPVFADEGDVSSTLARMFPASFPRIIGQDAERRWLLMEELPGRPLSDCEVEHWHTALAAFATVQIGAVKAADELLRAGCPDLGLARLRAWTADLLGPDGPVQSGEVVGLTPQESATLVARAPDYERAWQELDAFGIPETLEHGDFRPGHIVVDDDGTPRFFDLSDAAVSHPFFSAVTLLDFEPLPTSRQPAPELWQALRASYLQPWKDAFPQLDIEAAFDAARPLAVLHAALVRWFRLLPAMEPREKWEFMVPYWLRRLTN